MNTEQENLLFTATDPNGYRVVLTSERYNSHIISSDHKHQAHPEFTPDEIKQTIEKPLLIYESDKPDSDVYFSKNCSQYPKMYLKVAVVKYQDCGSVSTAYVSKHIEGGINEGGLKYADIKLGL